MASGLTLETTSPTDNPRTLQESGKNDQACDAALRNELCSLVARSRRKARLPSNHGAALLSSKIGLCAWRSGVSIGLSLRPTTCCASFAKIRRPPSPPLRRGQTTSRESRKLLARFPRATASSARIAANSISLRECPARHHVTRTGLSRNTAPRGPARRSRGLRVVPRRPGRGLASLLPSPRPRRPHGHRRWGRQPISA